jgi:hypothetical protein
VTFESKASGLYGQARVRAERAVGRPTEANYKAFHSAFSADPAYLKAKKLSATVGKLGGPWIIFTETHEGGRRSGGSPSTPGGS